MILLSSLEPSSVLFALKHTHTQAWDKAEVIINHKFADETMRWSDIVATQ